MDHEPSNLDQAPSKTIQNQPDGSYIVQLARGGSNVVVKGTWQVKAGFVIATMTNAPSWFGPQDPVARHRAESNKVVSIDQHKVVFLSSQDGTTVLTAHKQQRMHEHHHARQFPSRVSGCWLYPDH